MGVVQFVELEELLAELSQGQVVRVETLDTTRNYDRQTGIREAVIGVHVRAFSEDGHVLACCIVVAVFEMMGGKVLFDGPGNGKGKKTLALEKAEAVRKQVVMRLVKQQFDVRPGVIEIESGRLLAGGWSGLKDV